MNGKAWLKDTAERVAATFAEGAVSAIILAPVLNIGALKTAALAGLMAAVTYLKSSLALLVPNTQSPASLVPADPEPFTASPGIAPPVDTSFAAGGILVTILPAPTERQS